MLNCPQAESSELELFESVKDEKAEEVQKVERQFRRIYDPNASWVLVTGFPRPATDRILITFRSIGRIVGKDWSHDGLHLQFSDPCESARALELDKLCIAGYPVRIQALPRLTSNISGPLRRMGASSNRTICQMELQLSGLQMLLFIISAFIIACFFKFSFMVSEPNPLPCLGHPQ